jgi:ATP-dependent DNA helicase RecQ
MNSNTKYITGSFFDFEVNFVIENLQQNKNKKLDLPYSFYITEKNLLRGIKVKPSNYLRNKLIEYYPTESIDFSSTPYLISDDKVEWTDFTIQGNPTKRSDNPAYDFYKNLEKDLGEEYSVIKQFLIPEFEIIDFCKPLEKKINSRTRVDFFLPESALVIEIDGKQHIKNSDQNRDKELEQFNIKTVRIDTENVRNRDQLYDEKIKEIKSIVDENPGALFKYREAHKNRLFEDESYVYTSIAIHRLQILLCELIKKGQLSLKADTWNLEVLADFKCSFDWVTLAIDDFFEWLLPISDIYREKIKKPKNINISIDGSTNTDGALKIDCFLFKRPSEEKSENISIKSWYLNNVITKSPINSSNAKTDKEPIKIDDICDYYESSINHSKTIQIELPMSDEAKEGLNKYLLQSFGHVSFKDGQFRIIERVLGNKKTLGLLPTGGGKSLCFQLPGSLNPGCCIVVCPIVALMKDHKEELERLGFYGRVETITKDTDPAEKELILEKIRKGRLNFILISPERFQNRDFRESVKQLSNKKLISYVVIDEVHCLSEWGHDFRISYLVLPNTLFSILKIQVPVIGLTATASENVLTNIRQELGLEQEDVIYRMDNSREELNFHIEYTEETIASEKQKIKKSNKYPILLESIKRLEQSDLLIDKDDAGIIFTMHIDYSLGCHRIFQNLKRDKPELRSAIFSGSRPAEWENEDDKNSNNEWEKYKEKSQKEFKNNELNMMIATKSFGMGINKENIRYSIHYGMPASLEALYQEAGRCGRDGNRAENIIIFSNPMEIPSKIKDGPNVSVKTISDFVEENKTVTSDYIKQLRLLYSNKKTIKAEANECKKTLDDLLKPKNNEVIKADEKCLFRLFQLGIVQDWVAIDPYRSEFSVSTNDLSDQEIADNLLREISKYEVTESEITKHKKSIDKYLSGSEKGSVRINLIAYLIKWSNELFLYNRRRSLATLYNYCTDFKKEGSQRFKQKIDAYFRVDAVTESISKKIDINHNEAPRELKSILVKENKIIETEKVDNIISTITRFLESYKKNPWLDLLSSMCRLLTNSFETADGRTRLYHFINEAKKVRGDWKETLTGLLDFGQFLTADEREILSKALCDHIVVDGSDNDDLFLIHKYLGDNNSTLIFMNQINTRIKKML